MASLIRFLTLLSFFLIFLSLRITATETQQNEAEARRMYERWLVENQKNYNSLGEKEKRFEIFKDNLKFIEDHNSVPNKTYELGLTPFADLTNEEFRAIYVNRKMEKTRDLAKSERYLYKDGDILPNEIDWRKQGAVVPIKNQGKCGSGYAFSAIAAVEGLNAIKTGELISLSEQELVECDTYYNAGCEGGLMDYAFHFMNKNGGIDSEEDYPYTAPDVINACNVEKKNTHVVTINGFELVPENNEKTLQKAVANQPISVGIEADGQAFQLYKSGVFTGPCGGDLDHGVVVVGYGTSNGKDYWIIRNSWGTNWGEDGYMRLQRNVNYSIGKCGVAMMPSCPVKSSPNPVIRTAEAKNGLVSSS